MSRTEDTETTGTVRAEVSGRLLTITLGYAAFALSLVIGNLGLGQLAFAGRESKQRFPDGHAGMIPVAGLVPRRTAQAAHGGLQDGLGRSGLFLIVYLLLDKNETGGPSRHGHAMMSEHITS